MRASAGALLRRPRASRWRGWPTAGVLPPDDAALLIRADRVWRTVQGMLRITVGRGAHDGAAGRLGAQALLRAAAGRREAVDLAALRATLDDAGAARSARRSSAHR